MHLLFRNICSDAGLVILWSQMALRDSGKPLPACDDEKGTWFILPERPEGCCAQNKPGPFFVPFSLQDFDNTTIG